MRKISKWRLIARQIAYESIRNTFLEDLHSGISPSTKTGDYSDLFVITPYGKISLNEQEQETMIGGKLKKGKFKVSRISDEEMRKLMLEIEENLRLSLWYWVGRGKHKDKKILEAVEKALFGEDGISWDNPKLTLQKKHK